MTYSPDSHYPQTKKVIRHLTSILLIGLVISCQPNPERVDQEADIEQLAVNYTGPADVVEFEMFEGLSRVLQRDSVTGTFAGIMEIPDLDEAIFTYDIVVHKKDSSGRMIEVEPSTTSIKLNQKEAIESGSRFLWIGEDRSDGYLKNEELEGALITKSVASEFLPEAREVTVYTPKEVTSRTPHIYFTDGITVNSYAPYIDRLITKGEIEPLKLIGIHNSSTHRYEEYVKGGDENERFKEHQKFFYNEVVSTVEQETDNWKGDRYLYGVSNGAAFCMHAGLNNPIAFKEVVAFSTADYISAMAQWLNPIEFKFDEYPKFYMGAGRYEESIFKGNIEFLSTMKNHGIEVEFKEFVSGHDDNVWRIEFLDYLKKRFKKE